jgi:hypothetical protein
VHERDIAKFKAELKDVTVVAKGGYALQVRHMGACQINLPN